jgi:hypothetical protein
LLRVHVLLSWEMKLKLTYDGCRGGHGPWRGGEGVPAAERRVQGPVHVQQELRAGVPGGGLGRGQLRRPPPSVQVHEKMLAICMHRYICMP